MGAPIGRALKMWREIVGSPGGVSVRTPLLKALRLLEAESLRPTELFKSTQMLMRASEESGFRWPLVQPEQLVTSALARSEYAKLLGFSARRKLEELHLEILHSLVDNATPRELQLQLELGVRRAHLHGTHDWMRSEFKALREAELSHEETMDLRRLLLRAACKHSDVHAIMHEYKEVLLGLGRARERQASMRSVFRAGTQRLGDLGIDLLPFLQGCNALLQERVSPAAFRVFCEAAVFHFQHERVHDLPLLCNICLDLSHPRLGTAVIENYLARLKRSRIGSPEESLALLTDMASHAVVKALLANSSSPLERKRGLGRLALYAAGPRELPSIYEQRGADLPAEKVHLLGKSIDLFNGFGALAIAGRRPPSKAPSLLARFGNDVATVHYLNAADLGAFPGRGVLISNPRLDRIFVPDEKANPAAPPTFRAYEEAWPGLAGQLRDFPRASFLLARGMIAVSCAATEGYLVPDIRDPFRKIRYSLVIYNDHFHNPGCLVCQLVPTIVLEEKLARTLVSYDDFLGVSRAHADINLQALDSLGLQQAAARHDAEIFEVGRGTVLLRGYENNPLSHFSREFEEVENRFRFKLDEIRNTPANARAADGYFDPAFPSYRETQMLYMTAAEREEIELLHGRMRELQSSIALVEGADAARDRMIGKVILRHQNLLDLLKISLSLWHKGQTQGAPVEGFPLPAAPLARSEEPTTRTDGRPSGDRALFSFSAQDAGFNHNALRMLAEAYDWHSAADGKKGRGFFPVLAIAPTLKYGVTPQSPFYLDTFDMSGTIHGKSFQLPKDIKTLTLDDAAFWFGSVMPLVKGTTNDLRFYDRANLLGNYGRKSNRT